MASVFGTIKSPITTAYGDVSPGLPKFISNVVTVIFAAAGIFVFFNLIFAGFTYITSNGDQKKIENAISSINMSILGLVVMVIAAAVTGVVSYLLFGSATAILSPTINGPGTLQ